MKQFTNLYPVSKTLRFELIPQGETRAHLNDLIAEDEQRAEDYKEVKKYIDRYHKWFIDDCLSKVPNSPLGEEMIRLLNRYIDANNEKDGEGPDKVQDDLRKLIVKALKSGVSLDKDPEQEERFKSLFSEELVKNILPNFVQTEEEKSKVAKFRDMTTYFVGFHENRKNMYSEEAQTTAIGYRVIHENLPRFLDNIAVYEKVKPVLSDEIASLEEQLHQNGYVEASCIDSLFSVDFYLRVLTQRGIEQYNAVIGKIVNDESDEIKGLNERINLYNQVHKKEKLPLFKPMYKQILSDREQLSWLPETFENDASLLDAVKGFHQDLLSNDILSRIDKLLSSLQDFNLDQIWIANDVQLRGLSKDLYGDWSLIDRALGIERSGDVVQGLTAAQKQAAAVAKKRSSFSIVELNVATRSRVPDEKYVPVQNYFSAMGKVCAQGEATRENFVTRICAAYQELEEYIPSIRKSLLQEKRATELIKNYLDAVNDLLRFIKPLLGRGNETDKDANFYGEFAFLTDCLFAIVPLYNEVRNYLTQKPYSTEKFKLNFRGSTLLNGWDKNKERDNLGVILRKEGKYFLAIMNKKHNTLFTESKLQQHTAGECYEKMEYKLLPGPNKMLPKVFFSKKGISTFQPSEELLLNYRIGTHKKGEKFNLEHLHKLIDFYKHSIAVHEDWSKFDFHFSDTSSYRDISGFYKEVEQQGYKLTFRDVSVSYINRLVEEGKLYLFQIYNKDFSEYSKGTPNLHTLYWKMLFDPANLKNVVYKLNGEAEVFFRKKSLDVSHPTHPKNEPIEKKNKNNKGEKSLFSYDLIKDRRFTVDKFQFHVPITMNFKGEQGDRVNQMVQSYVRNNKGLNVIGIDRGERNLLYLVVINEHGEILEQFSLNEIRNAYNGKEHKIDYHTLLEERSKKRQDARQSWQTIEGIKDLKTGYLSQVIHVITQLMVKYNAIVVLEDLNFGFKSSRQKFEQSVYQQFERKLIDKLNFLVNKKTAPNEVGGLLNAYQLTAPFESFRKMGKQNGFLFYVPAWHTSKIDPRTGFVNLLDTRYENVANSKEFFAKFESITYNPEKKWFEFAFDYKVFGNRADGSRTKWTICTFGERIETFRNLENNNQWDTKSVPLTERLTELFSKYGIDYTTNLKEQILNQTDKAFFVELLGVLRLTLQLRNSRKSTGEDFLFSPVADENGCFFDSRKANDNEPKDADANGAYHIALKGLWVLDTIRNTEEGKNPKLAITNKEWLSFAQAKPFAHE